MADFPPIPVPLSHAYLITGGSSESRRAYAVRLAQAYVCSGATPPCGRCRHCMKAAEGIHPDVSLIAPAQGRRDILVEQARALRSDAYIRPNEAERKVYLIDCADSMNAAAQNSLLKVLEDGPAYAAFLLLAEQPGGLLQTIRSRCERIVLPPEEAPDDPEAARGAAELLARLAGGGELALAEFCVGLEKWERERFAALLAEEALLLRHALAVQAGGACALSDPARAEAVRAAAARLEARQLLDAAALCRRLESACDFNTGIGHGAGWLCAGMADIINNKNVRNEL